MAGNERERAVNGWKVKPPAFQFYPDDFIGGTVDLTAEEVGAYVRLLCYQWGRGQIPESKAAIDRVAGCHVSPEVLAKFENRMNPRLEIERRKQAEFRAERAESGRRGATSRWHGSANGSAIKEPMAKGMANDGSPSPSPSPSPISNLQSPVIGRFAPPTIDMVKLQCAKSGLPDEEAEKFMAYHEARGWMLGKVKMRSWTAALTTWKKNFDTGRFTLPQANAQQRSQDRGIDDPESVRALPKLTTPMLYQ